MKKLLVFMLMFTTLASSTITIQADSNIRPRKVMRIICTDSSVKVGDEFELKAKTSPYEADDDYLRWSIVGKKGIIRFDDTDTNDDEVEFVALKAGTTKVRCSLKGKSKKYSKTITIKVKKAAKSKKISRIGAKSVTVEAGDDFDLEVKKGKGVKERHLKWRIQNTSIVAFDEDCRGDEVELNALKAGTTVVTCKNTKTGAVIRYTVKVVNYDVEDNDDDDDD